MAEACVNPDALVFDIQRFCVHDGPGIRTTVFFKGCPFFCPWCANPESQAPKPQLLFAKKRCTGSGSCEKNCPEKAISMVNDTPSINRARCTNCGSCCKACTHDALTLSGQVLTVQEILATLLKDLDYYKNSGGGMTVSGGEPFMQPLSLLALLQEAKKAGLSTAVETTADVDPAHLAAAEPWIDHFLVDFKHPDAMELNTHTGIQLPAVLSNLAFLLGTCPQKIQVRTPLIPGFNDSPETWEKGFTVLGDLGISCLHILTYHRLGIQKYGQLGLDVPEVPAQAGRGLSPRELAGLGEKKGFRCVIDQ